MRHNHSSCAATKAVCSCNNATPVARTPRTLRRCSNFGHPLASTLCVLQTKRRNLIFKQKKKPTHTLESYHSNLQIEWNSLRHQPTRQCDPTHRRALAHNPEQPAHIDAPRAAPRRSNPNAQQSTRCLSTPTPHRPHAVPRQWESWPVVLCLD